jgi:hypothetical protein
VATLVSELSCRFIKKGIGIRFWGMVFISITFEAPDVYVGETVGQVELCKANLSENLSSFEQSSKATFFRISSVASG